MSKLPRLLASLTLLATGCAGNVSTPRPKTPPPATVEVEIPPVPGDTVTVSTPATTTTVQTTVAPTTTVVTTSVPVVINQGAEVGSGATANRHSKVTELATATISAEQLSQLAEHMGIPSNQLTPAVVDFLELHRRGDESIKDFSLWERTAESAGADALDLVTAVYPNSQVGLRAYYHLTRMDSFLEQWSGELAGLAPGKRDAAVREFTARVLVGEQVHGNRTALTGEGWTEHLALAPDQPNWAAVVGRVTNVAFFMNRFDDWDVPVPHGEQAVKATFGAPGKNIVYVDVRIGPGGQMQRVGFNQKVAHKLVAAFEEIDALGLGGELHSFGGSFGVRAKRTSGELSTHSWGIAIDVNSAEYPLGIRPDQTSFGHHLLANSLTRYGFVQMPEDAHHFQYATGY
ncbi:MAG: M15 family metallopeptidase [Vulcanimicrobiota bacterium]